MPTVEERVARGKREILADVASGRVPASAATFAELHDHVDANEYAGLTEDWPDSDADPAGMDERVDVGNAVQDALDAWIRRGGLRGHAWALEADEPSAVVHYLVTRGREVMLEEFAAASCVASCRVARELLRAYGVGARALQVEATVYNAAYATALEEGSDPAAAEGARAVQLGADGAKGDGRHPLHVALVLEDGLLDPSLDQADRPAKDIAVGPSFFPWPSDADRDAFLTGATVLWKRQDGLAVTYRVRRSRFFEDSPNWGRRDRALVQRMVGRMVREIREARAGKEADDGTVH